MSEKLTIILFSGDLDKTLAAFILATTASASGLETTIFFTFWGLNLLKKTYFARGKGQNIGQKLFNFMSTKKLPLSKFNMLGLGPWMMKKVMKKVGMAQLEELMATARQLGVKYVACTTSCGFMGLSRENLIPEVDDMVGAAAYLALAKDSKINLFI